MHGKRREYMGNTRVIGIVSGILFLVQVVFSEVLSINSALSSNYYHSVREYFMLNWTSLISVFIVLLFSISLMADSVLFGLVMRIIAAIYTAFDSITKIVLLMGGNHVSAELMFYRVPLYIITILISVLVVLAYIVKGFRARMLCFIAGVLCLASPVFAAARGSMISWQYAVSTLLLISAYIFLGLYLGGKRRKAKTVT